MIVVSNATPLIALTAVGSLELLANLFVEVHVPNAVYEEVVVTGAGKAGADAVAQAAWIVRRSVTGRSARIGSIALPHATGSIRWPCLIGSIGCPRYGAQHKC